MMVLDDLNAREKFLHMLEWMMALEQRHSAALQPGLVHITYDPTEVRDLTYSASDAADKLGEVMGCLQQAFRHTDLISREGINFWILTPFTQSDPVIDKVKHVIRTAPQKGLAIAQSDVQIFLMRDHLKQFAPSLNAGPDFLQFLLQHRTLASWLPV